MKKPIVLNDNYIDIVKVSFIGKMDTKVYAHLNRVVFFFTIIVEGKETNIESDTRESIEKLRNMLIHECGATVKPELIGLMPS